MKSQLSVRKILSVSRVTTQFSRGRRSGDFGSDERGSQHLSSRNG